MPTRHQTDMHFLCLIQRAHEAEAAVAAANETSRSQGDRIKSLEAELEELQRKITQSNASTSAAVQPLSPCSAAAEERRASVPCDVERAVYIHMQLILKLCA